MALRKTVTLEAKPKESLVFEDAYIRVNGVAGSKHCVIAHVGFYASEPKPEEIPTVDGRTTVPRWDSNFVCTKEYRFAPDLDGENFIAQAYAALKKQPEFDGALDC